MYSSHLHHVIFAVLYEVRSNVRLLTYNHEMPGSQSECCLLDYRLLWLYSALQVNMGIVPTSSKVAFFHTIYRDADKSLARPGRKQARKHVRDARDFNNIETRAVIKSFFPARQGAEGNSRHSDRNISLFPSWSS